MQFWRHGRTDWDGCQKGENSIVLEHSKRNSVGQRLLFWQKNEAAWKRYTQWEGQRRNCERQFRVLFWLGPMKSLKNRLHITTFAQQLYNYRQNCAFFLSLLPDRGINSHTCPQLDCLTRWQSDQTCHHPHRLVSLLQKVKSGMGSPDWNVSAFDIHPSKTAVGVLPRTCPGGGKWPSRYTGGKAATTSSLRLGRYQVLRSLRHCLWAQSQGHHTIDRLEKRGVERSSLKGRERAIVSQTNSGTVSKANFGKFPREGWSA